MCRQNQTLQVFDFVRKKKIVFFLLSLYQAKDGLCKALIYFLRFLAILEPMWVTFLKNLFGLEYRAIHTNPLHDRTLLYLDRHHASCAGTDPTGHEFF